MTGHIQRRVSPLTGAVSYRVRVYVGKREGGHGWVSGGTYRRLKAEAEPALEALLKRLREDDAPSATDETVAELLERWLRDAVRPDKRPNTIRSHEKAIALHIAPQLGEIRATELTPADVATWQAARIAAGAAPKSVRNYRGTLHACYAWALTLGLVTANPVSPVPAPRLPEGRVDPPSLADARRYIDALAGTRLWPALMLGALTGMRRGEVLALRWKDVNLVKGTVRVTRNLTGRNKATLAFGPPKTAAGRRAIALPAAAVAMLTTLAAEHRAAGTWAPEALICCGRRGQPIVPDRLTSELHRRIRRRGLAPFHFHALRHMVATEMLRGGVPMRVVADHLGHSHVSTTLGTYGHVTEADERAAAERLEGAWKEAGGQTRDQTATDQPAVDDLAAKRARKQA